MRLQPDKRAAADEQDVGGIHADVFLLRMLAPTLRRDAANGAFQDLQQGLLHAFAGNVARDRDVLGLAGDLVDLVDIDNAALGALHIVIGVLQQAQNDVLHVLAHVAGFGQRGGVGDGERHVEDLRQRAGEQGLARAGRPDHENVALLDLDSRVRVGRRRRLFSFRRRGGSVPGGCACNGCAPPRPASSWRAPGRCRPGRAGA